EDVLIPGGRVKIVEVTGFVTTALVEWDGIEARVEVIGRPPAEGSEAQVYVRPQKIKVFGEDEKAVM
ncbi:MAG: ABC transporter ATP-binding protein, partial [Thermoproteus sp.]